MVFGFGLLRQVWSETPSIWTDQGGLEMNDYEDDVFTGIAWALPLGLLVWALVWWAVS